MQFHAFAIPRADNQGTHKIEIKMFFNARVFLEFRKRFPQNVVQLIWIVQI
jgi:hypothetical protein